MKNKFILFLLISLTIFFITNSTSMINLFNKNINIFIYNIFPSLFFFFVLSDLLISYNFISIIDKILQPILLKLFNIGKNSSYILLMSIISGFPSGAKNIKNLYEKNLISLEKANTLITYTSFSNIGFILGTIQSVIKDTKLTIIILFSHFLSNFIIAFIVKPKKYVIEESIANKSNECFNAILSNSIINNIKILIIIFGTMIFISSIAFMINSILPINNYLKSIITGLLDLSSGVYYLSNLKAPLIYKGMLAISFISFGSLTVHMQVRIIINNTKIKYSNFLCGRISQVGISLLLYLLIYWGFY